MREPTVSSRWAGDELIWTINGEDVSDGDLRHWCWNNMESVDRYVDVVRQCHVNAWAARATASTKAEPK